MPGEQFRLADNYFYGAEGKAQNHAEAVKWYANAAKQGHVEAQRKLGLCYWSGQGVPKDEVVAAKWLGKAASMGDAEAEDMMGHLYTWGMGGITKNPARAAEWFQKAAIQEDSCAQSDLGICYASGSGVPKDLVTGYMWMGISAAQGDRTGKYLCTYEKQYITTAQIEEAKRRSKKWRAAKNAAR